MGKLSEWNICVVGHGDSLRDEITGTSRILGVVAVSSVICTGLPNNRAANGVGKVPRYFGFD